MTQNTKRTNTCQISDDFDENEYEFLAIDSNGNITVLERNEFNGEEGCWFVYPDEPILENEENWFSDDFDENVNEFLATDSNGNIDALEGYGFDANEDSWFDWPDEETIVNEENGDGNDNSDESYSAKQGMFFNVKKKIKKK